jgi:hypothetical protein
VPVPSQVNMLQVTGHVYVLQVTGHVYVLQVTGHIYVLQVTGHVYVLHTKYGSIDYSDDHFQFIISNDKIQDFEILKPLVITCDFYTKCVPMANLG